MPNLKFHFSRHTCAINQSLVRTLPLGGALSPRSLTYLSKLASATTEVYWVNKGAFVCELNNCFYWISYYDYFDILLLENIKLFSRQYKIVYILVTTILILYRKLYRHIVSIIVLNIEARQYTIKINLAIVQP